MRKRMKISINDLRKAIREVFEEEMKEVSSIPTVPASQSAGEEQFKKDTAGKPWGNPKAIPRSGTAGNKDNRVFSIVQSASSNMSPEQKQALRSQFDQFMATKDPSDKLIATAESLADEFMKSRTAH